MIFGRIIEDIKMDLFKAGYYANNFSQKKPFAQYLAIHRTDDLPLKPIDVDKITEIIHNKGVVATVSKQGVTYVNVELWEGL